MLLIGKHGNYLVVNKVQENANVHVTMHNSSSVSQAFSRCFVYPDKTWHTHRHSAGGGGRGRWAWGRTCGFSITTIIWLTHCLEELYPKVWFSCTGKLNRAWCGTHAAPNPFPAVRLLFVFSAQRIPRVQCFHAPLLHQCTHCMWWI